MQLRRRSGRIAAAAAFVLTAAALVAVPAVSGAAPAAAPQTTARTLLWGDDFGGPAGAAPNGQWERQTGGAWGQGELEQYTARTSNAALTGHGALAITARRERYTGSDGITRNYTSARLMGFHSFKYGYLVARMKIPQGTGLWPAFWTLGADIRTGVQWPKTGEIDVMEAINQMSFVAGTMHGPDTRTNQAYSYSHDATPRAGWTNHWHYFGVYWTANSLTWYFDGHSMGTIYRSQMAPSDTWEFNKPHVALLNLAVGGSWPGAPTSSTVFPAVLKVASVKLYNHP